MAGPQICHILFVLKVFKYIWKWKEYYYESLYTLCLDSTTVIILTHLFNTLYIIFLKLNHLKVIMTLLLLLVPLPPPEFSVLFSDILYVGSFFYQPYIAFLQKEESSPNFMFISSYHHLSLSFLQPTFSKESPHCCFHFRPLSGSRWTVLCPPHFTSAPSGASQLGNSTEARLLFLAYIILLSSILKSVPPARASFTSDSPAFLAVPAQDPSATFPSVCLLNLSILNGPISILSLKSRAKPFCPLLPEFHASVRRWRETLYVREPMRMSASWTASFWSSSYGSSGFCSFNKIIPRGYSEEAM